MTKGFNLKKIALLILLSQSTNLAAFTILNDSFESGDLENLGESGDFRWQKNANRLSIVTGSIGSNAVLSPEYADVNDSRSWLGIDGENAMRFYFPSGEPWTEQRYDLGQSYPEVWVRYWIRVPENFSHDGVNYKFFVIYMDGYIQGGTGTTVEMQLWPNSNGNSRMTFTVHNYNANKTAAYKALESTVPEVNDFIDPERDRGRWMQVVYRFKTSSSVNSEDGVIEAWRRWQDETQYNKFFSVQDAIMSPAEDGSFFQGGYFLGWANGGYNFDTEWLIDKVEMSENENGLFNLDYVKGFNRPSTTGVNPIIIINKE